MDTGATRHICSNKKMFSSYEAINDGEQLFMGNSSTSKVEGKGKVILKMTSEKELTLNDVLHVLEIRKNLVSRSLLSNKGFRLVFESDKFVLTKSGIYVGKGYMSNGLFKMNGIIIVSDFNNKNTSSAYMLESSNIWHGRLGHVNFDTLNKLMNLELLPKFKIDSNHKCEICVESKLTRASFHNIERSIEPLTLIHSDTCDLKYVQTRGGKKYLVTFIDDCTRYCYVYLLKSKDEALEKFMHYKNEVENQLGRKIKAIRSDRGGEYDAPFDRFCQEHDIIHQTFAPYTPQQNGIAERKNRTLKEMMHAMLISSGLPQNLWGAALLSANYILNRLPHKKLDKTPYELWKGRSPSYKYLKAWGCLAKVMVPIPKRIKTGPKTIDCIFIVYAISSSVYRFLVHKYAIPDIHVNTIIESRNASLFENIFPSKNACDGSSLKRTHDTTPSDIDHESINDESEEALRRSKRARTFKSFGPDFLTYLLENEPQSFNEAMSTPEAPMWKEIANSEIESIMRNHTWELVDLPLGSKPLGCKLIFKRKMKTDGSIDKYKARLVAKGYKQKKRS